MTWCSSTRSLLNWYEAIPAILKTNAVMNSLLRPIKNYRINPETIMILFNRILLIGFLSHSALLLASDPDLKQDLVQRRERVMEGMAGRGMLVLFSADLRTYSRDVTYEFRQENNLYYLTGIRQQGTTLVLMPQNSEYREILFLPDLDPRKELWSGTMLTAEQAKEVSGIANLWSASQFEPFIDSVLYGHTYRTGRYSGSAEYEGFFTDLKKGKAQIFLRLGSKPGLRGKLTRELEFANLLKERFTGLDIKDASSILDELRVIKSRYELAQIQEAIDITASALSEVMKRIRPGNWEYEIEALIEFEFKNRSPLGWAFPSIVASGNNATTLHYDKSERQTQEGELLLIDIGAQYNYYAADITRTIPCNGTFTPEQTEIYRLVLKAQSAAMEEVRPGSSLSTIHERAVDEIKKGLLRLGLITDKNEQEYRVFFPHGTAHFLGLDVHDVGPRNDLRPGAVLTVEPGIYVRQDAVERLVARGVEEEQLAKIRPSLDKYMSIGIRIEDDVLVTEDGYQLLSKNIPREIAAIELLMSTTENPTAD